MVKLIFPAFGTPRENALRMLEARLAGFSYAEIYKAQRAAGWGYAAGSESAMISAAKKEIKKIPGQIEELHRQVKALEELQQKFSMFAEDVEAL